MHAPVLLVQDDPFNVLKIHQLWMGDTIVIGLEPFQAQQPQRLGVIHMPPSKTHGGWDNGMRLHHMSVSCQQRYMHICERTHAHYVHETPVSKPCLEPCMYARFPSLALYPYAGTRLLFRRHPTLRASIAFTDEVFEVIFSIATSYT